MWRYYYNILEHLYEAGSRLNAMCPNATAGYDHTESLNKIQQVIETLQDITGIDITTTQSQQPSLEPPTDPKWKNALIPNRGLA